ncbi:MAG: polysaccharide biosynthesis protein, partial [Synechococcaceae bacterium WB9_2_112]|nr:polysaccharide biosynthesis protein [Synechococcaceae bacterium WB9_2_112]
MQLRRLTAIAPLQRRLVLMAVDALLLVGSGWMSFWLRLAHPFSPAFLDVGTWLLPAALVLGLPLYVATGQYKGLSRYVGSRALYDLSGRTALLTLLLVAVGSLLRWPMPPRSSWVLFWILLTGFTGAARFLLRDLLLGWQRARQGQSIKTVIYGAGAAGAQLAKSLLLDRHHALLAFVDDDPLLWGRSLAGVDVVSPQELSRLQADRVLLAMPSLKRAERRRIVDQLQDLGVPVLQVPSIDEISSGRARIDNLRPVAIEELLGRDPVPPNPELLGPGICGKSVLVSGAGGSIGSELCRQILRQKPRRLVLLERSEPSLYAIDQELGRSLPSGIALVPVLGSAADPVLVEAVLREQAVEVIFHAAAYKHVPMVEANPLAA